MNDWPLWKKLLFVFTVLFIIRSFIYLVFGISDLIGKVLGQ